MSGANTFQRRIEGNACAAKTGGMGYEVFHKTLLVVVYAAFTHTPPPNMGSVAKAQAPPICKVLLPPQAGAITEKGKKPIGVSPLFGYEFRQTHS